ncbi:MAG: aminoacyl-histidine dipeptidase [Prevotellaceae bacterium]|jgi:dipeptidase D|nr:aminoacyl-histidine dipeptidase [Prevotellaceae bacterium]
MESLSNLVPQVVFSYFDEICKIPRPSKKEEKIVEYLIEFAKKHSLEYRKDNAGNILITKPATKGKENVKTVVLQSHVDMVTEKDDGIVHDFENDPIPAYVEDGWVKAKGTTLGADCGIGMAAMLAVLADNEIEHGELECLFTVAEETGLTGAKALEKNFFSGKILLNLDSEDDGELFIGCAGGIDTTIRLTFISEPVPSDYIGFKLSIKGLTGGHSGDDINKGRPNAIKLLNRFLWRMSSKYDFRISAYDGGNLRNAIPREAFATFYIGSDLVSKIMKNYSNFRRHLEDEYRHIEKDMQIEFVKTEGPHYVIDEISQFDLLAAIQACPSGVIAMSTKIDGLVETSTNLASVKFVHGREVLITTSQRSSIKSKLYDTVDIIKSLFSLTSARVTTSNIYPGWDPNTNSEILEITKNVYKKLFNEEPKVKAVHAGLECGLFLEKYHDLDMISFGPTIRDVHSPGEKLEIATVDKFWKLLVNIFAEIPEQK